MIEIRDMKFSDHTNVREHLSSCWHDTYSHLLEPSDVKAMIASLDEQNLGLIPSDGLALVAVDSEAGSQTDTSKSRVVGTAIAAERHGTGYVWGMYVRADKKRCGIGRLLLNEVVMRLQGASQLSVIVLKASPDAEAFYEAQGFTVVDDCVHELATGKSEPASLLILKTPDA